MKKILSLCIPVALIGMISCNQAPKANNAMGDQNKATVDKYIQAVSSGDLTTMGDLLADGYKGYGPAQNDSTDKAKSLAGWKTNWDSLYSSIKYNRITAQNLSIAEGNGKGDWVLEWANITLNYKDGSPSATFPFHAAYQVENSKIVFSVVYYDLAGILRQRGYTFVPPAAAAPAK